MIPAAPVAAPVPSAQPAPIPVRLARISLRDFRAFPGGAPFVFDLGRDGKNLLLHGENGAGKSSFFLALRLLFNTTVPLRSFTDYHNVFSSADANNPGVVAVNLTAGNPTDYAWDAGNPHPAANATDAAFRDIARCAMFLDYKALLRTSLPHEESDEVNLFDLIVDTVLRNAELPDGRTVAVAWRELQKFASKPVPPREFDESEEDYRETVRDWPSDEEQMRGEADGFERMLGDVLGRIEPRANRYLSDYLQPGLQIYLRLQPLNPSPRGQDDFPDRKLLLTATYAGHLVAHPAQFLNEARLSAIALAFYLAALVETTPIIYVPAPNGVDRFLAPRLLLLDDPLLGLDLSHRRPLLDLIQTRDFAHWQILLLTYDANWFEMAGDVLDAADAASKKNWVKHRLHAKLHEAGWEMPVLMSDLPFLDRAWGYLQDGDYKAAGVYLRAAFESMLRDFCIAKSQRIPLKESHRDYKSEDFWPVAAKYVVKGGGLLVDEGLHSEIELQRRYVLNPLCHDDPARPTREEARRAHAALSRLRALLVQETAWLKQINAELQEAARTILTDDFPRLERALLGNVHPREFALLIACRLLAAPNPPLADAAMLLRSAFDRMLWRYCEKKGLTFIMKCDANLSTRDLWTEAKLAPSGLDAAQAAFVAAIETQDNLLLASDPTPDVCAGKSLAELETLAQLFAGPNWKKDLQPKATMDRF